MLGRKTTASRDMSSKISYVVLYKSYKISYVVQCSHKNHSNQLEARDLCIKLPSKSILAVMVYSAYILTKFS